MDKPGDSETAVKVAAQEFSDTIRDVERNMGTVQGQRLYEAILHAFEIAKGANPPFPYFSTVRQEIESDYLSHNRKPDTLTEVMRQLADFRIFADAETPEVWPSLTDKTVIVDLHGLTVLREMTVCLVLHALHRELMAMPDSAVTDGARAMRTIIVIDEAHHFLRDKKRSRILEKLIREIRSKGASVFLLSQSPDDYDQDQFDFAELLEFIFVLQANARSDKFLQSGLGLPAAMAKALLPEISNLPIAHALAKNLTGVATPNHYERLILRQFWRTQDTFAD